MRGMLLGTTRLTGAVPASTNQTRALLASATCAFTGCRYSELGDALPRLIAGAQQAAADDHRPAAHAVVAHGYILATRLLIKLDAAELGLLAADRAHNFAAASGDLVLSGEAARNMAVLARKLGWHDQATDLALRAAEQLHAPDPRSKAQRGLLLMSAGYTAAKRHDTAGLTDLTAQADRIAGTLSDRILLPTHGGGFGRPVVALHLISGHNAAGDPAAALRVAHKVRLDALPTTERRARYLTDVATSYGMWGKRTECLDALLRAERIAPQEVRTRPAVRNLVNGMLTSGRTSPELRGFAARLHLA
ncbi:hypothetical protein [Actinomadura harenae]|nr:hypothetical protein [Actinomadura harenae]